MSSSQESEKGFNPSMKDSFNIVYALAKGHAMCFLPFFRRNFGSEALGWPGLIAFILMLLVGGLGRIPEILVFMGVWMVAMVYQRVNTMKQVKQGVIRHSRYEGDVDTKLCRNKATVKQVIEPLACAICGVILEAAGCSHGLAMFVGLGCFSLAMVAAVDRQMDCKRLEAMRDAEIEQRYLAGQLRGDIEQP